MRKTRGGYAPTDNALPGVPPPGPAGVSSANETVCPSCGTCPTCGHRASKGEKT